LGQLSSPAKINESLMSRQAFVNINTIYLFHPIFLVTKDSPIKAFSNKHRTCLLSSGGEAPPRQIFSPPGKMCWT